jgi:hypothetical protein
MIVRNWICRPFKKMTSRNVIYTVKYILHVVKLKKKTTVVYKTVPHIVTTVFLC